MDYIVLDVTLGVWLDTERLLSIHSISERLLCAPSGMDLVHVGRNPKWQYACTSQTIIPCSGKAWSPSSSPAEGALRLWGSPRQGEKTPWLSSRRTSQTL